ncbi:MAG: choice-of-anchor tandem repeat GloVer-containing protein [Candidatus Cybelea sp.]
MKTSTVIYGLSLSATAVFLAACGGSQPPIGAAGATSQASARAASTGSTKYKIVYSFGSPPDGGCPAASLIDVGGTLYGTTSGGGAYTIDSDCFYHTGLYGTVFSITTGGKEHVLHSFGNYPDGSEPVAGLIDMHGTLYGTTMWGGGTAGGGGTVFSITTSGSENVLHGFQGRKPDGDQPDASLVELKGKLYGTTSIGGKHIDSGGTFFSLTTGGTEKVLHFFGGLEGANVFAGLINVGGVLYGTADHGGTYHKGVVFSLTPRGREKVLHSFGYGTDGAYPTASLIDVNGTLYGTTEFGGAYKSGTVFSISTSGSEEVLHSFGYGSDGADPAASLIEVNGMLYGTTSEGGSYRCGRTTKYFNCGTVFSVTPSGTEEVLHSFSKGTDGTHPVAPLIGLKGTLYGTTEYGGANQNGTIFALTP